MLGGEDFFPSLCMGRESVLGGGSLPYCSVGR